MVRYTSVKTYKEIESEGVIGAQALAVLRILNETTFEDMTLQEISRKAGIAINAVSGRVNELKTAGYLEESASKRKCRITGRTVQPVFSPHAHSIH